MGAKNQYIELINVLILAPIDDSNKSKHAGKQVNLSIIFVKLEGPWDPLKGTHPERCSRSRKSPVIYHR